MIKDVLIGINSIHRYGRGEEDSLEFTTDGYYFFDDDVACLSYMESEVTGLEGTRTSIMAYTDRVVVDRDGVVTSRMIFRQGEKSSFMYNTPYGALAMGISTGSISREMDGDGGNLYIDYSVDVENSVVARNRFHISVEEMGEQIYG